MTVVTRARSDRSSVVSRTVGDSRRPFGGRPRRWSTHLSGPAGLLLMLPLLAFLVFMVVIPLIALVQLSLREEGFGNFIAYFNNSAQRNALVTTYLYSALVAAVAVIVGAVVAWAMLTGRRRTKIWLSIALAIPFLMGSISKIYAFALILLPTGVINYTLTGLGIIDEPLKLINTPGAVVAAMIYQMLPFAALPLLAGFQTISLDIVQAAEGLGATRMRAIWSTVIPLSLPYILASFVIVWIVSIGFFLTPVLLGGATAPFTASLIQRDIFVFFDMISAAVSALVLLVSAVLLVGIAYLIVGPERLKKAVAS